MFIVKPLLSFLVGSSEVKLALIGNANCLLFDLVLVFVYLLFYRSMIGFLEEIALALCLQSVQSSGILSHATPTYYRYFCNNEIACSSLLSYTNCFKPFNSSFHLSYLKPYELCLELFWACCQFSNKQHYLLVNPLYSTGAEAAFCVLKTSRKIEQ